MILHVFSVSLMDNDGRKSRSNRSSSIWHLDLDQTFRCRTDGCIYLDRRLCDASGRPASPWGFTPNANGNSYIQSRVQIVHGHQIRDQDVINYWVGPGQKLHHGAHGAHGAQAHWWLTVADLIRDCLSFPFLRRPRRSRTQGDHQVLGTSQQPIN